MVYVIKDGVVQNIIELGGMSRSEYEQLEGVTLADAPENVPVNIGDTYADGVFYRDGQRVDTLFARAIRDGMLQACDYRMMPDYPCSQAARAAWAAYRQALRDVPQQEGFPETIEWPQMPENQ